MSRSPLTIFCDADVVLRGDEISITCQVLEGDGDQEGADFASCTYGSRPPNFPILSNFGGWFAGCRTNVFRDLGGFVDDPVEDVATTQTIKRSGYKIVMLPFAVGLRRPVRDPVIKGLGVLGAFMGHRQ